MSITRIVLTGGPCAGKSTGLAIIEQRLTNLGYKVIVMDEMPTNVLRSGLTPMDLGIDFQTLLVLMQKYRDMAYTKIIDKIAAEKIVILYDRGILDCQAYCSHTEFEKVLKDCGFSRNQLRDYYDGVFHLVTAADGALEHYTTENNNVRTETPEQAIALDKATMDCWVGHPHLRVINNNGVDFGQKMNKLMTEILSLLGEPKPLEIERKFLIEMPDLDNLNKKYKITKNEIIQTYLISDDNVERRIRQRGKTGDYVYYYTEKIEVGPATRTEIERRITDTEYISLMQEADTSLHQIKKTRYCLVYKDRYFELDIYSFWNDKAIVEIEVSDINDIIDMIPEFNIIKEVTDDSRYKNHSLAQNNGQID